MAELAPETSVFFMKNCWPILADLTGEAHNNYIFLNINHLVPTI
jgi:hypothetical protein